MRSVLDRMVEEARYHGLQASDEVILSLLKGPLIGLRDKSHRFTQFPNNPVTQIIFHCLTVEDLVCRNRDYRGPLVFGQPYYELTAGGVYLAEEVYQEYINTQTKH